MSRSDVVFAIFNMLMYFIMYRLGKKDGYSLAKIEMYGRAMHITKRYSDDSEMTPGMIAFTFEWFQQDHGHLHEKDPRNA